MTTRRLALQAAAVCGLVAVAWGGAVAHAGSFEEFFIAVRRDDVQTLQTLAKRGFDLNTTDEKGQNALYLAVREQANRVAAFLVQHPRFNVDQRNPQDETPLMLALLKGRTDIAKALVARGADVNKPGWTPLHYAATYAGKGAVEQVRWLLEQHAYIDAESPNGTTPLMMAAQYGSEEVARLLLDEGADPALRNSLGQTAIDFALRAQRRELAQAIAQRTRGARPAGTW